MRRKSAANHVRDAFVLAVLAVPMAVPMAAQAGDFSIKQEPGVSIPLSAPQSDEYDVGGTQQVKALFGLTNYLDAGPTGSFMYLPAANNNVDSGVAWGFGAGARLKRPHEATTYGGISPWIDADVLFVETGKLERPGFDIGAGLAFPIGEYRTYWVGPFVRYLQVVAHNRGAGIDDRDAKVLTVGVSLEFSNGLKHQRRTTTITRNVVVCPDTDLDTLPDNIDRCPEVVGPIDNWGCPSYKKIVVKRDKLELNEKLYFAWNDSILEEASFPILDEVVQALKENKGFRVQVEGHTSSEGGDDHNQTLSEKRAEAVLTYLVSHGIAKERLVSKGFASSVPISTNTTAAGREANRRVEFVVYFTILKDGTK